MPVEHARVKALFFEAMDLPEEEVGPWLRQAAGDDAELYTAVAELLDYHDDEPLMAGTGASTEAAQARDPVGFTGQLLADRYAVENFVAEGGFAFVYRATDTQTGEPVALKLFKEVDPEQRDRLEAAFRRESTLLAKLAELDPTFVRPHGLARWSGATGQPLLVQVLEWLDGHALDVVPGGRTLTALVDLLAPIAGALALAHDAGIAHRDVTPGNIFVQPDGRVRLLDFGIAKVAHDRARGFASTATASSAFTLNYAAPEQILNHPTGPWTDVYALAIVVVEQLAGRHPYAERGALEVMMALADPAKRPTPSACGLRVSAAVESALAAALGVAPESRPDMAGFWASLAQAARL